jgi:hypothetical protein
MVKRLICGACVLLISTLGTAEQTSGVGAKKPKRKGHKHEHGKSEFRLISSGTEFGLEGALPLADLVGFERAPKSEQEKKDLNQALELVKTGKLIAPDSSECSIAEAKAVVDPDFSDKVSHYEVDIEIAWKCAKPVVQLKLDGFTHFKNVNSLNLIILNQGKQASLSVKRSDHKSAVSLPGK